MLPPDLTDHDIAVRRNPALRAMRAAAQASASGAFPGAYSAVDAETGASATATVFRVSPDAGLVTRCLRRLRRALAAARHSWQAASNHRAVETHGDPAP